MTGAPAASSDRTSGSTRSAGGVVPSRVSWPLIRRAAPAAGTRSRAVTSPSVSADATARGVRPTAPASCAARWATSTTPLCSPAASVVCSSRDAVRPRNSAAMRSV